MREVHGRLTPEHFEAGKVPDVRRLRIHLSGEDLSWDVVEAVADVCFPDEPSERARRRVRAARDLWDKAHNSPTVVGPDGHAVVSARELVEEKDRTIQVYRDLVRARQAYETSEQGREQALRIASMLFLVLGQAQAKVAELSRRIDALTTGSATLPGQMQLLQPHLDRARGQEVRLSAQLERAVRQRDEAQRIADLAARRVEALEAYLLEVGQWPLAGDAVEIQAAPSDALDQRGPGAEDAFDHIDELLARTADALDREEEAVQDAADDLGAASRLDGSAAKSVIPGELVPGAGTLEADPSGLSGTTPHNPNEQEVVAQLSDRLHASERRRREAAVTLQRSLLPQELEQPDDLRIGAAYQPGGSEAAVGGDWYDVITLGAGRTALVIGDVVGRGVRAAAVMGQLRAAVRAYARLDLPPHEVLQLLDGLAAEIDASQIATCVYAVHNPNEGLLTYASAGHLPILVRDADGTIARAADRTGPPLGTGAWLHSSGTVAFGPGSTAVLYTDGLVKRRGVDIDAGVVALERALARAQGASQVVCDRLMRALGADADHDDDVAILVVQHPTRTGPDAELFADAALELPGVEPVRRARAFTQGVFAAWRFPAELCDLGVMAVSELVANSIRHGTPPMRLHLRRTDRRLVVEVSDGDDHLPRRRQSGPGVTGHGISIIATIASSWGSRRTPDGGKAVWCEFLFDA